MSVITKLFGTYSERQVKKIIPIVDKIEALADKYKAMTDEELQKQTPILKSRLAHGETKDDILPDAFALVREAADRVLGTRHYRVQLIGGIILHQGRIAEMKTGEGKTQVATLPAYLNALDGNGVHIVTVNDYLARRDSEWMGRLYNFLGISVGLIVNGLSSEERKNAYACDITYGTNNEMGFDYLRDNMVVRKESVVQRDHVFAIVDEVDSILIDEARTPLIISGAGEQPDDNYKKINDLVSRMSCKVIKEIDAKQGSESVDSEYITDKKTNKEILVEYDYIVDEKARTAVLTKYGVEKAEKYLNIGNLSDEENQPYRHYIDNAIHAWGVKKRDIDYIVKDGKVLIVDSFTGRIMHGRRFSNGLHQAIEAKENVKIGNENLTQATITFQNYFRLYKKLSGMTGTALTEDNEFREIYSLDVVEIPTNKPVIRKDHTDVIFKTVQGKYINIVNQIKECASKGQPVLVGTVSIEKSEKLSEILKKEGIKHNVLNAKYHEKEAEIIAQAGKFGAVTISTNMAGRGTDIKLGGNAEFMAKAALRNEGYEDWQVADAVSYSHTDDEIILAEREHYRELLKRFEAEIAPEAEKVKKAGGLFIIGTERHESRRIDNQLRGRSGRQGDPGESRFYLSMEDDLMRLFGTDRVSGIVSALGMKEDTPLNASLLANTIESAQKRIEANNFDRRKHVLEYDDVMNRQREIIYAQRREVLNGDDLAPSILKMMESYCKEIVESLNEYSAKTAELDEIMPKMTEAVDFLTEENGISDAQIGAIKNVLSVGGRLPDFTVEDDEYNRLKMSYDGISAQLAHLKDRFNQYLLGIIWDENEFSQALKNLDEETFDDTYDKLLARLKEKYEDKRAKFDPERFKLIEKRCLISSVDRGWINHLEIMDDLQTGVGLNAYAQRNPITEYKIEGFKEFENTVNNINFDTIKSILTFVESTKTIVFKPIMTQATNMNLGKQQVRMPIQKKKKSGPNEPCPCGSGLKYKKCCMAKDLKG